MTNQEKWNQYLSALNAYATRNGHARVPASHVETLDDGTVVNLGTWVGYVRQRQRAGLLKSERAATLEIIPGWEWGPLPPAPQQTPNETDKSSHFDRKEFPFNESEISSDSAANAYTKSCGSLNDELRRSVR